MAVTATKARRWLVDLETITIPIEGPHLRRYRAWSKRRLRAHMTVAEALRFADEWLPSVRERWLEKATDLRWDQSTHLAHVPQHCREQQGIGAHVGDVDGQVMHLLVHDDGKRAALVGERCFRASPDKIFEHTWTDDDRLTRGEIGSGVACRGCGRPLVGGPPWVPIMQRTPEQSAAIEAEEDEFKRSHPACAAMRWSLSGSGIHHCGRCCAPPPVPDEAVRLLAQMVHDGRKRDAELAERWKETARRSVASEAVSAPKLSKAKIARLRRDAEAIGFRIVPIEDLIVAAPVTRQKVGRGKLYGGTQSELTLEPCRVIEATRALGVTPPSPTRLRHFTFAEHHGWGRPLADAAQRLRP